MAFDRKRYMREYMRKYFQRPGARERILEYRRKYWKRPETKKRKKAWSKKYRDFVNKALAFYRKHGS